MKVCEAIKVLEGLYNGEIVSISGPYTIGQIEAEGATKLSGIDCPVFDHCYIILENDTSFYPIESGAYLQVIYR